MSYSYVFTSRWVFFSGSFCLVKNCITLIQSIIKKNPKAATRQHIPLNPIPVAEGLSSGTLIFFRNALDSLLLSTVSNALSHLIFAASSLLSMLLISRQGHVQLIRMLHSRPLKLAGQRHSNALIRSVHVPSFWQGLEAQSSISESISFNSRLGNTYYFGRDRVQNISERRNYVFTSTPYHDSCA